MLIFILFESRSNEWSYPSGILVNYIRLFLVCLFQLFNVLLIC